MKQTIRTWLEGLDQRERRLVITGAALFVILILYVAIWEPLTNSVENLRTTSRDQQATLGWMKQAAAEIQQLRGKKGRSQATSGQSLLTLVDRTAKSSGLGTAMKRVQPDGEKKVRVWMEGASFDDVIRWLVQLESRHGVGIESTVFELKENAGRVDAQLVLEASA